jgi:hypothetical protein
MTKQTFERFICEFCGNEFCSTAEDDVLAREEFARESPEADIEEAAIVCDDCYQYMNEVNSLEKLAEGDGWVGQAAREVLDAVEEDGEESVRRIVKRLLELRLQVASHPSRTSQTNQAVPQESHSDNPPGHPQTGHNQTP